MNAVSRNPLGGMQIVALAINLPGPIAAQRLTQLGAAVTKFEPPDGDPLESAQPDWYCALSAGQTRLRVDLKTTGGQAEIRASLEKADLLLTSIRPATLGRLGLDWDSLHGRYPRLCMVSIVGYAHPDENRPGHDLTYQAAMGLIAPPRLPMTLIADLAGGEEAVTAAMSQLLARERGRGCGYAEVSLAEAARRFAQPLQYGLTSTGGILGGAFPGYQIYKTKQGWIAVAALEPRFWSKLLDELAVKERTVGALQDVFLTKSAAEWDRWAAERDLPLSAVRTSAPD